MENRSIIVRNLFVIINPLKRLRFFYNSTHIILFPPSEEWNFQCLDIYINIHFISSHLQ